MPLFLSSRKDSSYRWRNAMKNQISILIGFVILTAAIIAVSFYAVNRFYGLRAREIAAEFNFQCAQTYRYTETLKSGVIVSYPMQKEYNDCVSSKGKLN
jgi:hypothetical protein